MGEALDKPISFILFILIGYLLKRKISAGDETNGLKSLILSIVLPVTIFIALLKIKVGGNLILFPAFALGLNLTLFSLAPLLLYIVGIEKDSPSGRSARLLIPSLAPGLSCFAFILEFLGEEALAKAAMSDLGNKFFVLFLLYLVAIKWHYKQEDFKEESFKTKLKSLGLTLLYEPVNIFIILALILVGFGVTLETLPNFLSLTLTRLSAIMTPLVLIFIGLAVKFKKKQFFQIFSMLMLRASFVLLIISAVLIIAGVPASTNILIVTAFSLSACSFWPFAHISAVEFKEKSRIQSNKTFNSNFALSILALSLPISVLLILGVLSAHTTFQSPVNLMFLGCVLFGLGIINPIISKLKMNALKRKMETSISKERSF
ncbi:MAG: permease [Jejuia sp.]